MHNEYSSFVERLKAKKDLSEALLTVDDTADGMKRLIRAIDNHANIMRVHMMLFKKAFQYFASQFATRLDSKTSTASVSGIEYTLVTATSEASFNTGSRGVINRVQAIHRNSINKELALIVKADNTYFEMVQNSALEYAITEDSRQWIPNKLNSNESQRYFGKPDLYTSIVQKDDLIIEVESCIYEANIERDDFFMEPLAACPQECKETLSKILDSTNSEEVSIPICMSFYQVKHVVFNFSGCTLCVEHNRSSLYAPESLIDRIRSDMKFRYVKCIFGHSPRGSPMNKTTMIGNTSSQARQIFQDTIKRPVYPDNVSAYIDGYKNYCVVRSILSITMIPGRKLIESHYNSGPVVFQGACKVVIYAHAALS